MMIRPASALQNEYHAVSDYCHKKGKPVFITKDGEGDLVVMSLDRYHAQNELIELRAKLLQAELEIERGEYYTLEEVEAHMEAWLADETI